MKKIWALINYLWRKKKTEKESPVLESTGIKVLGLSTSGRKDSRSEELLWKVLNAAKQHGAEVEMIRLCDKRLAFCETGCCASVEDCVYPCVHNDDTNEILAKIIECHSLVIASPVHWGQPAASGAVIIEKMTAITMVEDELAQQMGREPLEGKPCAVVCSYEYEGASILIQSIAWSLDRLGFMLVPYGGVHEPRVLKKRAARWGLRAMGYTELEWIDNNLRLTGRSLALIPMKLQSFSFDDYKIPELPY